MLADLRLAFRLLHKTPGFTLACILTLALGIGANSAMFSILHRLLWNPLDLPHLDRLVTVHQTDSEGQWDDELAPRTWLDLQAEASSLESLAGFDWRSSNLTGGGDPERVQGFQVSREFFSLFGVRPAIGRTFSPEEAGGKGQPVAMLSHALWRRRFGADPGVVGRSVVLDGTSYTVVGVMPDRFRFPSAAELWTPWVLTADEKANRSGRYMEVVGRLRDGADLASAQAEIRQLGERMAAEHPQAFAGRRLRLLDLATGVTEDTTRAFIYTVFYAALGVLLIACANVAGLYLARGSARRKELAVRLALGARRARIVRQLLTETLLLGVAGGTLALVFAAWVVDAIKSAIPPTTTRYIAGWYEMGIDPTVTAFTFVTAVLAGVLFGLLPAIQLSRGELVGELQEEGRATGGRRTQRARSVLVVLQAALALALLVAAGGLVKGFRRLVGGERQFVADGVLTMSAHLPETRYPKPEQWEDFHRRAVERLAALPGVTAAAAVNNVPWGDQGWASALATETNTETRADRIPVVDRRPASPGYLSLLELPLVSGRWFGPGDVAGAPRVAVISQLAARTLWPGEDAVGKRFHWGRHGDKDPWVTVVGVVADLKRGRDANVRATTYEPMAQVPMSRVHYVVRTDGDPLSLARSAREAIYSLDGQLPVASVRTLDEVIAERLSGVRIGAQLMAGFALIALLLAALGIYGVVAYLVTQRTREIGIRMALGAQRMDVLGLVMRRGVVLTAIGVAIGLATAWSLVRLIEATPVSQMIDADAPVFLLFTLAVIGFALLGSYLPARRATRVDPLVALRRE